MPNVARGTSPSMDTSSAMFAPQISGSLIAGENLDGVSPCYIRASDGRVYMTNGTAANEAAKFDGFCAKATKAGESVTLFGVGARFRYATGLTIGQNFFAGTTAGVLSDTATTGGTAVLARAINATDIRVVANFA
ncbi:hypothetical protein [Gemmatimonas sp.]|uniref:hypothetical protein n=1 Tax=Gemmatimonas sp. TaxID=1962908 RepID=UPI00333EA8FC